MTDCQGGASKFVCLVNDVFQAGGIVLSLLIDEYEETIHRWLPILDPHQLQELKRRQVSWASQSTALLWLSLLLVTTLPCGHREHIRRKRLYIALRSLIMILEVENGQESIHLLIRMLIALYECGHGMNQQAHLTISAAGPLADAISSCDDPESSLRWKVLFLTLDRSAVAMILPSLRVNVT